MPDTQATTDTPPNTTNAAADARADAVLYVKSGCPWCEDALRAFHARGLAAQVRDVIRDPEARQRMLEISRQTKCPTFECGGFVVADFDMAEFDAALAAAPAELRARFS
ncbi:MAG: glutaredoxin family protein [Puniceicoccales bacterium]|jgi:glutaredoxin|nr:glutaredoxin family protein [Puniceicoccales bacterium]